MNMPAKKFKVVVSDFISEPLDPERRILGNLADVVALDGFSEEDVAGRIEDAHAIMLYHHMSISRKTIDRLVDCKLIVRCGVGYDNIDCAAARERGIAVANVPDYGTEEVADSAIALMMSLARGTHRLNSLLRAGIGPWHYTQVVPLHRLRERTFGIVGLGRIGTAAALRAKALGMKVVYFDPYKPYGYDKALGIARADSLDELLPQSHVLSLHCALTEETHHLIDGQAMSKLPFGAYLVNTARGAVVDTSALPALLASGQLSGAGIDVLAQEPPSSDDPLIAAWRDPEHAAHHNLIVNPHLAFYSEEGLMDMRVKGSHACLKALRGQPIPNLVN
jgi:D-3-phosphoglycerate dehydrogenase/C-terminal binding protein